MVTTQWKTIVPPMSAPLAIFVNSANQLIIKSYHAQLRLDGAAVGSRQVIMAGAAQTPSAVSFAEFEAQLPIIEVEATRTDVSGTSTPVNTTVGPMQPPGVSGITNCQWQFSKGNRGSSKGVPPTGAAESMPNGGAPPTVNSLSMATPAPIATGSVLRVEANSNPLSKGAPADPTGFSAQQTPSGQVQLNWNAVPGVTTYLVGGPSAGPNGLKVTGTTTILSNIPVGQQEWTVASWYDPGGLLTNWQHWPKARLNVTPPPETPAQTSTPRPGPVQVAPVLKISDPGPSAWEAIYQKTNVGSWKDYDNWMEINLPAYLGKQGLQLYAMAPDRASSIIVHLDPPTAGRYGMLLELQCQGPPAHVQLTQATDSYNNTQLGDWVEQTQSSAARTFGMQKDTTLTPGGFQYFTWKFVYDRSGTVPTCTFVDLTVSAY
jgi:hypothetical protein